MNWPKHITVPWRAGKRSTTIVCNELAADAVPGSEDRAYYKGYLLGESMAPSTIAHTIALHNAWVARNNSNARNQWAEVAAKKIAHDVIVHEIREEGIKAIILDHAPVEIEDGTAPCGHLALVRQARAFLAEMAARAEDDEGTSAEKLREALKPFEDVEP